MRYVSANGNAIELGPNGNTQCGGYPGLCLHHDVVRREAEKYLRVLASHFKERKSLVGYDCWNEPHLEPAWIDTTWANMGDKLFCYCNATRNAFREWLEKKYNSIDVLNKTWTRKYCRWDEVTPPNRQGHYVDWLDWSRFWFSELSKQMQWRYDILKTEDAGRFVMSHSGAVPPFLPRANSFIHNWLFAEPVDLWGTSMAPRYHNWSLAECAGVLDVTRSAARGKEFWISELTGGSCNVSGFLKTPTTRPKDIRVWNWMGVIYGAKAIVYWCYLTESTGLEAGSYGLVAYNGRLTKRAEEAAAQAYLINDRFDLIRDHSPKPDVAILYDPDNSSLLFAMDASDQLYGNSHIGYYKCVWQNDLYARYVTYNTLDEIQEKVLIVPMCLTINAKAARLIEDFVQHGGILVAEARTGLCDENGYLQPELPANGLTKVAGLTEGEARYSDPDNKPPIDNNSRGWTDEIDLGPEIEIQDIVTARIRVRGYIVPLHGEGAQCIGKWNGDCLATHYVYGQGEVYYFGTYLGLALFHHEKGAHKVLSTILNKHIKTRIKGNKLRPRLVEKDNQGILAVFNDDPYEALGERIQLPAKFKSARSIFTGESLAVKDNSVEIKIDPGDVAVYDLS